MHAVSSTVTPVNALRPVLPSQSYNLYYDLVVLLPASLAI